MTTTNLIVHLDPSLAESSTTQEDDNTATAGRTIVVKSNDASPSNTTLSSSSSLLSASNISSIVVHIHDVREYNPLSLSFLISHIQAHKKKHSTGPVTSVPIQLIGYSLTKQSSDQVQKLSQSMMLSGLTLQSQSYKENDIVEFTSTLVSSSHNEKSYVEKQSKPVSLRSRKLKTRVNEEEEEEEKKTDTATEQTKPKLSAKILLTSTTINNNDDFIDEDELLETSLLEPPPQIDTIERQKQLDDCGGRKPCDDCTCGRAEREGTSTTDEKAAPAAVPDRSACGNCAKGDAFRCAGCPFLGKPAFKEGEEHLILEMDDDFDDL